MGNGCQHASDYQKSASYKISHEEKQEQSIFLDIAKRQSHLSYPELLNTLDNFEEGFFQKGYAFDNDPRYLVEAQTQTVSVNISLKNNDASTQTIVIDSKKREIEYKIQCTERLTNQMKSKLHLTNFNKSNHNEIFPIYNQNYLKTAMKPSRNHMIKRCNRNSQSSLERQLNLTPPANKRYMTPIQKCVRFSDSKFSLPILGI